MTAVSRIEKAQPTRDAIVSAATRLFAVRVPEAVTIDDITRAALVAKGSFYNHFADKSILLQALVTAIRSRLEPIVGAANRRVDDPAVRLSRGLAVYVRFALDEPDHALVLVNAGKGYELASAELNRGLITDLVNGLASARFSFATIDAAVLFVEGIVRQLLLRIAEQNDEDVAITISQQLCSMLLRGLGVEAEDAYRTAAWAVDDLIRTKN